MVVSILLIDDDAAFRDAVKLGLEDAGYDVTATTCGDNGVKAFERDRQDVVITDVVMDQGEGHETLLRLLELAPDLSIIALSAHEPYLQTMKKLGAAHTLTKPFRMAALIEAVRSASGEGPQT